MNSDIASFAELARQYCAWAEGPVQAVTVEVSTALSMLSRLYAAALALPDVFGTEEVPRVLDVEWRRVYERFGALPFNYYSSCLEPHNFPGGEMGVSDVADDLADIWRDLMRGLMLFESGAVDAAAREWRFHFHCHWGEHATGALHALHCWRTGEE